MIRSLRARVLAAFALLGLAFLLSVGGALFVVLRDLNQQSQEAALTEALVPFVVQVRLRLVAGTTPSQVVAALTPFTQGSDVSVFLTDNNGQVLDTGSDIAPGRLVIPGPQRRGDVTNGTYQLGGRTYQYVAATLFADATPGRGAGARAGPPRHGHGPGARRPRARPAAGAPGAADRGRAAGHAAGAPGVAARSSASPSRPGMSARAACRRRCRPMGRRRSRTPASPSTR